ncbi:hypothetical protein [Clostridium sp. HMP27]|uniref:hypothetical protein n=1 Tax=Clostridium sp. HMP27 TaxID=1487921 RepID=UPI00052CFCFE|nr:hypothetical protein [Clostridium sp. HMP27]KGK87017.1 hypothetical protein DP68_12505 [Clostridium sp. HMP27]
MAAYSNRRRDHIHFIKQYNMETGEYTGTRIVIFMKPKYKSIHDIGDFQKHPYKSPKSKKPNKSLWKVINCDIGELIKKEMINVSEDNKYIMRHILYENPRGDIESYINDLIFKETGMQNLRL